SEIARQAWAEQQERFAELEVMRLEIQTKANTNAERESELRRELDELRQRTKEQQKRIKEAEEAFSNEEGAQLEILENLRVRAAEEQLRLAGLAEATARLETESRARDEQEADLKQLIEQLRVAGEEQQRRVEQAQAECDAEKASQLRIADAIRTEEERNL